MRYVSATRVAICALATALSALTPTEAAESNQVAFNNRCRTCHSVKADDNRPGPSLHNILGRKAGAVSEYAAYSQAMKTSGIVWDEATLSKFIENPDAVVPGNNMKPYAGITDESERTQIVEYLASISKG
jgi:cytochrome c